MRKKIGLLVIGIVVVSGAFFGYRYFTDASFQAIRSTVISPKIMVRNPDDPLTVEGHYADGPLQYVMHAKMFKPVTDAQGQKVPDLYEVTEPEATYYSPNGSRATVKADRGTVQVEQVGKKKTKPFGGKLSGNIRLILETPRMKPIFVTLEKDVELSMTDSSLRSEGAVHVKSEEITFEGENLTVMFSKSAKGSKGPDKGKKPKKNQMWDEGRIEFVRIDPPASGKTNSILIKNIGKGNTAFLAGLDENRVKNDKVKAPATNEAAATQATKPDTYRFAFNQVKATLGKTELTAEQLHVLFMMPSRENRESFTQAALAAETQDSEMKAAATKPAPEAGGGEDLRVTWTGPMEMRPAGEDDLELVDDKDRALEAVGTKENPVMVVDRSKEEPSVVKAGRLWWHKAEERVELEAEEYGIVDVTDPAMGHAACQGVTFWTQKNQMMLKGPGTLEMPQALVRKEAKTGERQPPVVIAWKDTLDAELTGGKNALDLTGGGAREKRSLRHVLVTGDMWIRDPGMAGVSGAFEMNSQTLDMAMAKEAGGKAPPLEHLVATAVKIRSARSTGVRQWASLEDKPDGITGDKLEVFTAPKATGGLAPSRMLATGNVVAWGYGDQDDLDEGSSRGTNKDKTDKAEKHLVKRTITTASLDVTLEPREKDASGASPAEAVSDGLSFGNGTPRLVTASEGVKFEMDGMGNEGKQKVVVTAKTLVTDRKTGKATLKGDPGLGQANAVPMLVELGMDENKIVGKEVLLDQNARSIEIPGDGTFTFVDTDKKTGKPMPMEIHWTTKMTYDHRAHLARFNGLVSTKTLGWADQDNHFECKDFLEVQLAKPAQAKPGEAKPAGGEAKEKLSRLVRLEARGDVTAWGTQFDPKSKKVLTRVFLKTPKLTYTKADELLTMPERGAIQIENYEEPPAKPKAGADAAEGNGLALMNAKGQDKRGVIKFFWSGSLTYSGKTGLFTMNKDVEATFTPMSPLRAPGQGRELKSFQLFGDVLTASVVKAEKDETGGANPMSMATDGGKMDLGLAKATGHARLNAGDDEVNAEVLEFDNLRHIAKATGKPRQPATFARPGQDMLEALELEWDLSKDKQDIKITRPHGKFSVGG